MSYKKTATSYVPRKTLPSQGKSYRKTPKKRTLRKGQVSAFDHNPYVLSIGEVGYNPNTPSSLFTVALGNRWEFMWFEDQNGSYLKNSALIAKAVKRDIEAFGSQKVDAALRLCKLRGFGQYEYPIAGVEFTEADKKEIEQMTFNKPCRLRVRDMGNRWIIADFDSNRTFSLSVPKAGAET